MTTETKALTRADVDVVLAALAMHWLSTLDVLKLLIAHGFNFAPDSLREVLRGLVADGRAQGTRVGALLYWRIAVPVSAPEPGACTAAARRAAALAPYVAAVEQAVEALRQQATAPPPAGAITLAELDAVPIARIVRRAKYEALRAMLRTVDGWVEGAQGNHEALSHRDEFSHCCGQFDPQDIRRMVNDAARDVGTAEPYVENGGE